jgi:hypothetical protein
MKPHKSHMLEEGPMSMVAEILCPTIKNLSRHLCSNSYYFTLATQSAGIFHRLLPPLAS